MHIITTSLSFNIKNQTAYNKNKLDIKHKNQVNKVAIKRYKKEYYNRTKKSPSSDHTSYGYVDVENSDFIPPRVLNDPVNNHILPKSVENNPSLIGVENDSSPLRVENDPQPLRFVNDPLPTRFENDFLTKKG